MCTTGLGNPSTTGLAAGAYAFERFYQGPAPQRMEDGDDVDDVVDDDHYHHDIHTYIIYIYIIITIIHYHHHDSDEYWC